MALGRFLLAVLLCGLCAAGGETGHPLARIELSLLDGDAIAYGTFQSHNQKVVSVGTEIFATYIHKSNTNYTAQQWRLLRSDSGGKSFKTVLEDTHATSAPAIEVDRAGHLFLCRPDFNDGNAYFYQLDASRLHAKPQVSKVPGGSAGKYCLLLDEPRKQLYWFAHNNSFHVIKLDGTVRTNLTLLTAGKHAVLQYPHLTLDMNGTLYAAWTTAWPTGYFYRSVQAIKSADAGHTWQSLEGRKLELPIVADDSGPSTLISKETGSDAHTWLSAFMAKDGKLHFVYWAETKPQRQWYRRYDTATGKPEIEMEHIFSKEKQSKPNDSGVFAARRTVPNSTLYFVSTVDERKRLACLASDDNGQNWYEYATSERLFPFRVYSIGAARELTGDGTIVGTFTDVEEKAKSYYEDNSGHVYFFRIQAGLCAARLQSCVYKTSLATALLNFGGIQGQPEQIRLGSDDGSWGEWHAFAQNVQLPAKSSPKRYQFKSRLGVLSAAQAIQ